MLNHTKYSRFNGVCRNDGDGLKDLKPSNFNSNSNGLDNQKTDFLEDG